MAEAKPTGAAAELADLPALDARWAAGTFDPRIDLPMARSLIAALGQRLKSAEADLRFAEVLIAENGSLKRRITELRRGLNSFAGGNCLTEIYEYKKGAGDEVEADDRRRRRFEKKQKAARRG